ncbi:MAG: hypothetical protein RL616_2442, partial [Verrucomicrobiota bacterium]
MSSPSLLLLIPAYNEEARIEPVLRLYADFFQKNYAGTFQMVVVLNGCKDNTLGVVQALFFGLKAAVLAIVLEAVVRIGRRSLKNNVMLALAA